MSASKSRLAAGLAMAGLATAGVVAVGANAFAETDPSASPITTQTQTQQSDDQNGQQGTSGRQGQQGTDGQQGDCGPGGGRGGASQDTAVTGDEAQKVKDAVAAKDADATITEVRKDPDGSYDALGTKADGSRVFYDVSSDLATVPANAGGGQGGGQDGQGRRGHGGQQGQNSDQQGQTQQGQTGQSPQASQAPAGEQSVQPTTAPS